MHHLFFILFFLETKFIEIHKKKNCSSPKNTIFFFKFLIAYRTQHAETHIKKNLFKALLNNKPTLGSKMAHFDIVLIREGSKSISGWLLYFFSSKKKSKSKTRNLIFFRGGGGSNLRSKKPCVF